MGLTPLDGLVMATRPGSLDPGAVVWAMRRGALTLDQVEEDLEHRSGLAGLSVGSGGDLRRVLESAGQGDHEARLAYAVYLHRLRAGVAAMVAALGGLDGLVFTGGVGENSARVRADACAGLGFLGLPVPPGGGGEGGDRLCSEPGRMPAVVVVEAREDLEIARLVRSVLG
jgi:acetate kinase